MRPATVEHAASSSTVPQQSMPAVADWREFAFHLARKQVIVGNLLSLGNDPRKTPTLRALWQITDLSSSQFADEIAQFYQLKRVDLSQLLAASSLAPRFARRFIRETSIFPCSFEGEQDVTLVVADPTDRIAIRAAGLVLSQAVHLAIASFEDILTVLSERLGGDEPAEANGKHRSEARDNDIENLRDLASGAPVV